MATDWNLVRYGDCIACSVLQRAGAGDLIMKGNCFGFAKGGDTVEMRHWLSQLGSSS